MEEKIYLTRLPAKVLDIIFKKLHFEEKLQLAQADPILGEAFAVHCRSEYAYIDIRKLSVVNWPVVLSVCGTQVRQINGTWDSQNNIPFQLIENQCPFLESILFNVNNDNLMQITSLLLNVKSLRSVHLHISENCDASMHIINALMQLPSLTRLLLHGFSCNAVYHIPNLIHLENLSLTLRSHPEAINIFEVLSALRNLSTLFISNMNILENQDSYLNELEILEIFSCHMYSVLPYVPKLKSLRYRRNMNDFPDFRVFDWISMHAYTLEFLELQFPVFTNAEFGQQGLLQTLQNCTNLRTLYLCDSITWLFVEPFMNVLNARGFSPERPFNLVLRNFDEVKSMFRRSPFFGLLYLRGPTQFEICAWDYV